ncbi:MAG: hypothetical protein WKF51_07770 [Geodermatophilaceae bacterium]
MSQLGCRAGVGHGAAASFAGEGRGLTANVEGGAQLTAGRIEADRPGLVGIHLIGQFAGMGDLPEGLAGGILHGGWGVQIRDDLHAVGGEAELAPYIDEDHLLPIDRCLLTLGHGGPDTDQAFVDGVVLWRLLLDLWLL